jgi:hypothetical protein
MLIWASERFTHIEITIFKGRSIEVKRALYRAIVEGFEPFGVPPNPVKVILIEVQPSEIGLRGGAAACGDAVKKGRRRRCRRRA